MCYFSASQTPSFLEENVNCFRKQEAEMETPCDSREGPHWWRRAHPLQGHFAETPHFSVLRWQGATTKHVFSRGIVIAFNCFSPPLPATVCSLPIYGILLFNLNNWKKTPCMKLFLHLKIYSPGNKNNHLDFIKIFLTSN